MNEGLIGRLRRSVLFRRNEFRRRITHLSLTILGIVSKECSGLSQAGAITMLTIAQGFSDTFLFPAIRGGDDSNSS